MENHVSVRIGQSLPSFVNNSVSWQAKLTNVLLRRFVKPRIDSKPETPELRAFMAKLDRLWAKKVKDLLIEDRDVAGIPCRWVTAPTESERVLLYLHGGGFTIHLPRTYDGFVARICQKLGANALIPDYRLVPEHPFPAAVEDCFTTYKWLLDQNYSADKIIIAGDSAGGCLTLTTLLQIRDAQLPMPAAAILLSPGSDCRASSSKVESDECVSDPMLPNSALDLLVIPYANGADETDPLLSPVFGEYHGMPPMQFHVGSTELVLSHSTRVVEKAAAAGVDVKLNLWKELPHVHSLMYWLPESKLALSMMVQFSNKHLR